MGRMTLLVTLYWLWFAASLAILARRAVRKLWRTPADATPAASVTRGPAAKAAPAAPAVHAADAAPAAPAAPAADAAPRSATPGDVRGATPPAVPRPDRSPVAGARTSLAEALAGIRMPLDLAPLSHFDGADPTRRLVLATSACPATAVDAALTEELERLGYAVERTGPTDVLAHRGDHAVALHMRTIAFRASGGPADAAYPTAPVGSVVVDLQLR